MKLEDPRTIRMLIRGSIIGLILLALIDLGFHHHAHFTDQNVHVDAWPFFYPVFGFAACVAMVWFSKKVIGHVLMRPEDYYYRDEIAPDDAHDAPEAGHASAAHDDARHPS